MTLAIQLSLKTMETRKSSCVNARGILTAAYQVLHLLSCTGGGGGSIPARGYPTLGTHAVGTPPWVPPVRPEQVGYPCQGGTPSLLGGTPPWVPRIRPGWGIPLLDLAGVPLPRPAAPGWGNPPPAHLTRWGTPLWTDGQTHIKT